MYCPKCGANQSDEMRFCNLCGANLSAVRRVVDSREAEEKQEKVNWDKTWMAEMFLSQDERRRRKHEIEKKIDPDIKRANEIRGGVITSCAGVGLMIFLYVFMRGLNNSGLIPATAAEILSHVWIAGIIPFFVGIGLMINGLVFTKRLSKAAAKEIAAGADSLEADTERSALRSADTTEFITPDFSVTEETTKHLKSTGRKQ